MDKEMLYKNMASLGYQLMQTDDSQNANDTLAEMVKSDDVRLFEGFPVVLLNAFERSSFNQKEVESYLSTAEEKKKLKELLLITLVLFEYFEVRTGWKNEYSGSLSKEEKAKLADMSEALKKNSVLKAGNLEMSAQRLKNTFENYFSRQKSDLDDLVLKKNQLRLEYSLSQVFSPKQKELFFKKLRREKLTKTEAEYFSRTVKKKVLALANTELHQLASKLLEEFK